MAQVFLKGVNKTYGGVAAVRNVSFHVRDGEFVALVGPSGCGKTTTLNLIAGLIPLTSGEIQIGDSVIMYADVNEETSPSSVGLMLYVDDVDAAFARAVAAGATSQEEPSDKFYGDRMGTVGDPYGNWWSIGTHIEDVSMEEMERRMAAEFGASGGGS